MNRTAPARTNHPPGRSGFTLLELLGVIAIIAILVTLLLPAIRGAIRTARVAETSSELTRIDSAIAQFSGSGGVGIQPWSELILTEDPAITAWTTDTQTKLRRMFESMDFSLKHDFNGDGDQTDVITMTGSECLVLFLGGVPSVKVANTPQAMLGLSKNPLDPFNITGSNRLGPFFTFNAERLRDSDSDGMLEYFDDVSGQTTPLHFASSNNGQGYSPAVTVYVQADGSTPINANGHQLISPGDDLSLGFVPYPSTLPAPRLTYAKGTAFTGSRAAETDNIANFAPGVTLGN